MLSHTIIFQVVLSFIKCPHRSGIEVEGRRERMRERKGERETEKKREKERKEE